jgi:queuine tRNA-ribosyltransferase
MCSFLFVGYNQGGNYCEMSGLTFEIQKQDDCTAARAGVIRTRRGDIETPHFVPVATLASARALDSADLEMLGAQCALVNTYHLHLKPGDELIKRFGGTQKFMNFNKPLFSDSGGFQAFSLGLAREHNIGKIGNFFPEESVSTEDIENTPKSPKENLTKITDAGVEFRSIYDGSLHFFDARRSMEIQANLGADIIMAFDECTSPLSDKAYTRTAMERTHEWAKQSWEYHDKNQALYGIIQGGYFRDLRDESVNAIGELPFDGIAIGGSLGNSKRDMHEILEWVVPQLDDRPRHLLGIGEIDDIFECVQRGIDTFDCVAPTRIARRANLYILPESGGKRENKFRINISSAIHKEDAGPVDPACGCPTCRNYSRAYLRHLYLARELTYFRLGTIHNLWFMLRLMETIRENIKNGNFMDLKAKWLGDR